MGGTRRLNVPEKTSNKSSGVGCQTGGRELIEDLNNKHRQNKGIGSIREKKKGNQNL